MTERVRPPFDGSLAFLRAWCREHGGTLKIVHKNPRGVIEILQGGMSHIYHHDKYGKHDRKYSWGSSIPVDFMAQCMNAYHKAHPDRWKEWLPYMKGLKR